MTIYSPHIPYTYFIGWSKTNMGYYGVKFAKNCNPKDFWVKYFTSSKRVAKYIMEHGMPDVIEIRKTFIGENRVNNAREWEHRVLKRIQAVDRSDFLNMSDGKSISPESSSLARTGVSPGNKGKPQAEYIKNKKRKPKPKVTCPKCGKIGGSSVMSRHHFDNCGKELNTSTIESLRKSNKDKYNRQVVIKLISIRDSLSNRKWRKICQLFTIKPGWYQLTDDILSTKIVEITDYLSYLNDLNLGNLSE